MRRALFWIGVGSYGFGIVVGAVGLVVGEPVLFPAVGFAVAFLGGGLADFVLRQLED